MIRDISLPRLVYVNPQECADQFAALMELTGGRGHDDVCHYTSTHIMGTTGGNTEDLKEAIRLAVKYAPAFTGKRTLE